MDKEHVQVVSDQMKLRSMVGHEGWPIARGKFIEQIIGLQNAFEIKADEPQKMLIDLEARKLAVTVLTKVLQDIEGTATQAEENEEQVLSYVVRNP